MGPAIGNSFAAFTVIVLPGLAGFLVWELKENWKLYRATRAQDARAARHRPSRRDDGRLPQARAFTRARSRSCSPSCAAPRGGATTRAIAKQHEASTTSRRRSRSSPIASSCRCSSRSRRSARAMSRSRAHRDRLQPRPDPLACPSVSPSADDDPVRAPVGLARRQHRGAGLDRAARRRTSGGSSRSRSRASTSSRASNSCASSSSKRCAMATPPPPYDIADEGLVVWPGTASRPSSSTTCAQPSSTPAVRGAKSSDGALSISAGRHALFGREPLYWSVWSTTWQQIQRGEGAGCDHRRAVAVAGLRVWALDLSRPRERCATKPRVQNVSMTWPVIVAFSCALSACANVARPPASRDPQAQQPPTVAALGETLIVESKILGERRVLNVYVPPGLQKVELALSGALHARRRHGRGLPACRGFGRRVDQRTPSSVP